MIDTAELRGIIAKEGYSGAKLAKELNMAPKTFYEKMKKGVFGSDEIEKMIELLAIKDPMPIFFMERK